MNDIIKQQLAHRSIRKFKDTALPQETIDQLVDVARHTSTSSFMQSYSIISVTDPAKKQRLAEIGKQQYIAESGHLFVMIADLYRNHMIASENQKETDLVASFDKFLVAASDALLAAQNIVNAAESLGIGAVFLGSILNEADQVIALLDLPEYTFPVLGIALGYPDQSPQLKPRLPKEFTHFENSYPRHQDLNASLKDYDAIVTEYYDLRDANKRIDSFTNQVNAYMNNRHPNRSQLLKHLHKQKMGKY